MNQHQRILEIRKKWNKKPCDHPKFEKEYINNWDSGDYFCVQCGEEFAKEMKDKILKGK